MVAAMSSLLTLPKIPHTKTRSAGTNRANERHIDASPCSTRTRSASPASAARCRANSTSAGSRSTSSASTSPLRGWAARTSITSRPWPAHRLTIRMGSTDPDRPADHASDHARARSRRARPAPSSAPAAAARKGGTTDPRRRHANAPSAKWLRPPRPAPLTASFAPVTASFGPVTASPGWSPDTMGAHRRVEARDRSMNSRRPVTGHRNGPGHRTGTDGSPRMGPPE